jgi:RimJ/RimL family protein N-acetyltransferase
VQYVAVAGTHPAIAAPLREVVTARLWLRPLSSDDLDELVAMFVHREVWEFEYGRGMKRGETEAFLDRQMNLWAGCGFGACGARELAHRDLVGVVGLGVPPLSLQHSLPAVTVGWRFSPTMWGRGYATEAAISVLDQAFTTMGLDRVGCATNAQNRRSIALANRLGMSIITETRVPNDDGEHMVTAVIFQLARNDWLTIRGDRSRRT